MTRPPSVRSACEILGLDPFQTACEGRFAAFVPARDAPEALAILQATSPGASLIGQVTADPSTNVLLKSAIGAWRLFGHGQR